MIRCMCARCGAWATHQEWTAFDPSDRLTDRVIVAASPCRVGVLKTRARLRRAGWGV